MKRMVVKADTDKSCVKASTDRSSARAVYKKVSELVDAIDEMPNDLYEECGLSNLYQELLDTLQDMYSYTR